MRRQRKSVECRKDPILDQTEKTLPGFKPDSVFFCLSGALVTASPRTAIRKDVCTPGSLIIHRIASDYYCLKSNTILNF